MEKLSWQFAFELDQEEEKPEADDLFLDQHEESNHSAHGQGSAGQDKATLDSDLDCDLCEHKQDDFFYNKTDIERHSGIIFDENRLERAKITQWSQAPKIRPSKIKILLNNLFRLLSSPFLFLFKGIIHLINFLGSVLKFLYITVKELALFPVRLLNALKQSFIYLFGDFSWLQPKFLAPAKVATIPKKGRPAKDYLYRLRAVSSFLLMAVVITAPLQVYVIYKKSIDTKGAVMGAAVSGLDHLKQAGIATSQLELNSASNQFLFAENQFDTALDEFSQLAKATGYVLELAPEYKNAEKLIIIAKASAQIGSHLSAVVDIFNHIKTPSPDMTTTASEDQTEEININISIDFEQASQELGFAIEKADLVSQVFDQINLDLITPIEYQQKISQIKSNLPLIVSYLKKTDEIFNIFSYISGCEQPRRLMLVFANNSEARPVIGFPGSYAIVDTKDGRLENIDVPGGGFYDLDGSLAVQVEPFYPFKVFSPVAKPWNFNIFPDWPASANRIQWFYENSGGSTVDGVIIFSPNVLEDILALTGDIEMPVYDTVVNAENFVRIAQTEVELEYDLEENKPKKFIGDLLPQVLKRVFSLESGKVLELVQVLNQSLNQKQLLVYLNDSDIQQSLSNFGWDGSIIDSSGDYLSVIHTNIAGGKTDRVIENIINHQAEIRADGTIIDTVTLTRNHNGNIEDYFEGHTNSDYVRFYVPAESKLIGAFGFDGIPNNRSIQIAANPDDIESDPFISKIERDIIIDPISNTRITNEFNKTVFGNWINVSPGESKTAKIVYMLPFKLEPPAKVEYSNLDLVKQYFFNQKPQPEPNSYVYTLAIQKQAGSNNTSIHSRLVTDSSWRFYDYLPKNDYISIDNNYIDFNTYLNTDYIYGAVIVPK